MLDGWSLTLKLESDRTHNLLTLKITWSFIWAFEFVVLLSSSEYISLYHKRHLSLNFLFPILVLKADSKWFLENYL